MSFFSRCIAPPRRVLAPILWLGSGQMQKQRQSALNDPIAGHQKQADPIATQKQHKEKSKSSNLVIDPNRVVWQGIAQQVATIQRGNGHQVEKQKRQIDFNGQIAKQGKRL